MNEVRRKTVLVVSSVDDVRETIRDTIAKWGYRVIEAKGSKAALSMLARGEARPDLVLTDRFFGLGEPLGEVVTRAIKVDCPQVKVILMSGDDPVAMKKFAAVAGADGFLTKPFRSEVLLAIIERVLGQGE